MSVGFSGSCLNKHFLMNLIILLLDYSDSPYNYYIVLKLVRKKLPQVDFHFFAMEKEIYTGTICNRNLVQ